MHCDWVISAIMQTEIDSDSMRKFLLHTTSSVFQEQSTNRNQLTDDADLRLHK